MIPPRNQWCHQISVTSLCWPHTGLGPGNWPKQAAGDVKQGPLSACSNCTRLLGHEKKRYFMTPEQFELCVKVARDFCYDSPRPRSGKHKPLGIFGGEPLMSPHFADYVDILCYELPEPYHRGLWTSFDWETYVSPLWGPARPLVEKLLDIRNGRRRGYLNWNDHAESNRCEHHPNLVAIGEVIKDEKRRWELISECWLNRDWSAAYALDANGEPKFYFCEVASAFDRVLNKGVGLPVVPGVWNGDLSFEPNAEGVLQPVGPYAEQIKICCTRCGQAMPQSSGRRDLEMKDDISPQNLVELRLAGSPMVERGDFVEFDQQKIADYNIELVKQAHYPGEYVKQGKLKSRTRPKARGPIAGK